jgi:2-oxoglutarate ferredoxin oxidoreductase subunit alpha
MEPALSRRPAGPGISLMNEFIGLAYYAEVPAVLVRRATRRPIHGTCPRATQQCDVLLCAYASHGDTRHVLLLSGGSRASASKWRRSRSIWQNDCRPRFSVLSDLDIGMNDWMCRNSSGIPIMFPTAAKS